MKDNKGYSLVELVIVIAIISAIGGMAIYSISLLIGQYARECANNTSAVLDKEKNYALTKSATIDCYVEIVMRDDDGYYARYYVPGSAITKNNWVLIEEQKIGKKSVSMVATLMNSGTGVSRDVTIDSDTSIKIVYNRSSGAFKGTVESDGSDTGYLPSMGDIGNEQCTKIMIEQGREYEIQLYPATGKHVLSRLN